jgi:hypothetical protein
MTLCIKKFSDQEYNDVLTNIDPLIVQFSVEDIVTKFELLQSQYASKLNGVGLHTKQVLAICGR